MLDLELAEAVTQSAETAEKNGIMVNMEDLHDMGMHDVDLPPDEEPRRGG